MVRPKADTPEGRKAIEKWRKTTAERYGEEGVSEMFRQMGSLGGRAKVRKGFATNHELAVKAGRKGGKKSRRTGVTNGQGKKKEYYYNGDRIFKATKDIKEETHIEPTQKKSFIKRMFGGE